VESALERKRKGRPGQEEEGKAAGDENIVSLTYGSRMSYASRGSKVGAIAGVEWKKKPQESKGITYSMK
jgi:hypothetical protein